MTHPETTARELASGVRGTADAGLRALAPSDQIALAQVYATLTMADALSAIGTELEHLKTIGVELGAVSIAISDARS